MRENEFCPNNVAGGGRHDGWNIMATHQITLGGLMCVSWTICGVHILCTHFRWPFFLMLVTLVGPGFDPPPQWVASDTPRVGYPSPGVPPSGTLLSQRAWERLLIRFCPGWGLVNVQSMHPFPPTLCDPGQA